MYVLNGQWDIEASGNYPAAGTLFTYTPSTQRGESLKAQGPLTEPIDLMVNLVSKIYIFYYLSRFYQS